MEDKTKLPLSEIMMSNGKQTAEEWLMTQPEAWREIETEAIYECLKKGWPLHLVSIQSTARELAVPGNPNGW